MSHEFDQFIKEFIKIKEKGWIESLSRGKGNGGITFEKILNIKSGSFEIPDYGKLEIKVFSAEVNKFITLFSATPDGTFMFEIKRLIKLYGYPDKHLNLSNVLNVDIFVHKKTLVKQRYFFSIQIDKENQQVILNVFDKFNFTLDTQTTWSFCYLKEKLLRKLQYLAIVKSSYKKDFYQVYYRYNDVKIYSLIGFDEFLILLEKGIIKITFKIGVYRSGPKKGNLYDHGTSFSLDISKINDLYTLIYSYSKQFFKHD